MLSEPLTLNLKTVQFTDEQFYQLCIANPELQVERSRSGEMILPGFTLEVPCFSD